MPEMCVDFPLCLNQEFLLRSAAQKQHSTLSRTMPRQRWFSGSLVILTLLHGSGGDAFSLSPPIPRRSHRSTTIVPIKAGLSDNVEPATNDIGSETSANGASLLLEDLETEMEELRRELELRKETYDAKLKVLDEKSKEESRKADLALQHAREEYENYRRDMKIQLEQAPSASEVSKMETELSELRQRFSTSDTQLHIAKTELLKNREARKQLQAEMVATKHTYLLRMAELEDLLESEQDGRAREKAVREKELNDVKDNYKKKLSDTLKESKQHAAKLTADFENKLQLRDEEIDALQTSLKKVEAAIGERELRIAILESERTSLRKVTQQWLRLVRQKIAGRLSRKSQQEP